MSFGHLVRFADETEYRRAIRAFIDHGVSDERVPLADHHMAVTNRHLEALDQAGVQFQIVSKTTRDNGKPAAVQS